MRQARRAGAKSYQLGAGILLGVSGRLEESERREWMHAIDDTGLFHRMPHTRVLGLNRKVTHRIDRTYQTYATAPFRYAIYLVGRENGILHRQQSCKEDALRIFLRVLIGPIVIGTTHRARAHRVSDPWIGIDVSWNDHNLIDSLNVHVLEPRLRLIGARVVDVGGLLLCQRSLRVEIAHVKRALNVVLEPGPGER